MDDACRTAEATDLDALVALELRCFHEDPWTRGMLSEELSRPGGIFVVIGPPGAPIGFAIAWAVLDDLHVLQVAVDPDRRRGGLGKRLVTELEKRAPRVDAAWLEVRRDNAPAIGLYEGCGYRVVGARPKYYTDGCDALLLRKTLRG